MKTFFLILFGIVVAVISGLVAWLFGGPGAAIVVAVLAIALAAWATRLGPGWRRRGVLSGLIVLLVGSVGLAAWQGAAVARALRDTSGPVAAADPAELMSANSKLGEAGEAAGFRLELDEDELTALVQDGLAEAETPLASVNFDVRGSEEVVRFEADFRSGDLTLEGAVRLVAERGGIDLELVEADIGAMTVPGALTNAIEDITGGVTDFEGALAESGSTVQSVTYTDTSLVLVGTSSSGEVLTSDSLLNTLRERTATLAGAVEAPPERLGPGRVNDVAAQGSAYVVALGDSLAANVGVSQPRDGYVSRFHAEVEHRDATTYGLRNFGVSGETAGSLLNGGQLNDAVDFMTSHDISYVTIDIGANDLLGHMGSPDCGDDLTSSACQQRIGDTLTSYEETLGVIVEEISSAAEDAELIFLQTYNPFSLGLGSFVEFESRSDEIVSELNDVAFRVASARGFHIADGFMPMRGTTAATTHMVDSPPDIHPNEIGFDVLAFALVEALD